MLVKMRYLYSLLSVLLWNFIDCKQLENPEDTTSSCFPYVAYTSTNNRGCAAIIISAKYVLTPANCVNGSSKVIVYVGATNNPVLSRTRFGTGSTYNGIKIKVHAGFKQTKNSFINNIALVEVQKPILFSSRVQPAELGSANDVLGNAPLANVSGWYFKSNTYLKYMTGNLKKQHHCKHCFGGTLAEDTEMCFVSTGNKSLDLVGNPVELDGHVVGFLIPQEECTNFYSVLNLSPLLKWISVQSGVEIKNLDKPFALISNNSDSINNLTYALQQATVERNKLQDRLNKLENEITKLNGEKKKLAENLESIIKDATNTYSNKVASEQKHINDLKNNFLNNIANITMEIELIDNRFNKFNNIQNNVENRLLNIENATKNNIIKENKIMAIDEKLNQYKDLPKTLQKAIDNQKQLKDNLEKAEFNVTVVSKQINDRLGSLENKLKSAYDHFDNKFITGENRLFLLEKVGAKLNDDAQDFSDRVTKITDSVSKLVSNQKYEEDYKTKLEARLNELENRTKSCKCNFEDRFKALEDELKAMTEQFNNVQIPNE